MAIDKSTRQHYAIQGGGPNYLGKQKMVTAPKKWLSSPDHEPAELAYITKKEKDILLDLNIYGSLKNGKPNRGPSGIMSLQGDMGSIGGGGGGSSGGGGGQGGGGGGGGGWDPGVAARERAAQAARDQASRDRAAASIREQAAQRDREAAARNRETISKNPVGGIDQFAKEMERLENAIPRAPGQTENISMTMPVSKMGGTLQDFYTNKNLTGATTGGIPTNKNTMMEVWDDYVDWDPGGRMDYKSDPFYKVHDPFTDVPTETISKNPIGGLDQFAKEVGLLEDQYAPGTKLGLGDLPGTMQDYYKNKLGVAPRSQFQVTAPRAAGPMDYLQQGYQPPVTTGAGMAAGPMDYLQPKPPLRTRIQDDRAEDIRKRALGNIALQTDKSLMDVSDPSGQRQDIMSGFADMGTKEGLMSAGKNYAKKAAINYALQKTGLGFINPLMGLASLFGFKMPKGTGTKTAWQPDDSPGGDGGQGQGPAQDNVIQASIQKFSPEQADMMKQRHSQLQGVIDSGVYQGRQLTAEEIQMLQQKSLDIQKLMEQYLVDPEELGLARGGLASLWQE